MEDLTDVIYLNSLDEYYNGTVLQDGATDKEKAKFTRKHEVVRALIHSALSTDICEEMKHHEYNRSIHRGKDIVDFAERSVKVISGNIDRLYNNIWKDIRRIDFSTWAAFITEFRKLYGKLKESEQEVTLKSACIHLFKKVRTFLPIWTEINESQYYSQPNVERLLLELEIHGRQLEYDGITLANLRTNGDWNPRDFINESRARGAGESSNRIEKNSQREVLGVIYEGSHGGKW